jgi:hypothetical protein
MGQMADGGRRMADVGMVDGKDAWDGMKSFQDHCNFIAFTQVPEEYIGTYHCPIQSLLRSRSRRHRQILVDPLPGSSCRWAGKAEKVPVSRRKLRALSRRVHWLCVRLDVSEMINFLCCVVF